MYPGMGRITKIVSILLCLGLSAGCASLQSTYSFDPSPIYEVGFRDRAISRFDPDVRVTVAIPTADETEALFGANLIGKEIQPVWVRLENHGDKTYHLISTSADPNYFSPLEVVYAVRGGLFGVYRDEMQRLFRAMSFKNPILPGTSVSGFIFTNLDEGEKVVQIDLIAAEQVKFFTFFLEIPGMRVDYSRIDFDARYPEEQIIEFNEAELRAALERMPCCTTNKEGTEFGDPINLVIIGEFKDVAAAFARQRWLPAEEKYGTAIWKTVKSFLFGSNYRYSTVSPLYVFQRSQDFARQKPRHDINERNHLRLWRSPWRLRGQPVFVGQVSRDIGVRFTSKTWPPVTHKIDPDIDEARSAIIEDLIYSQMVAKIGFVNGVGRVRPSNPRSNLTGDPYFTDGYRTVLIMDRGPIALDRIQYLDWEAPETFHISSPGVD